jgi:DNA-binding Xre family transcriptional regulator
MKNRMKLNAANLKEAIARKRMKKVSLAQDIGVTRETLSRWLAGKSEYIDEEKLLKLSALLDCDPGLLSPEIPLARRQHAESLNPKHLISGDDLLRLGIFSGQWAVISSLYQYARYPEILVDHEANFRLFRAFSSIMQLEIPWEAHAPIVTEPLQLIHERFDVMARAALSEGLQSMLQGEVAQANQIFKRVILRGQTEWVLALAYFLSAICDGLASSPDFLIRELGEILSIFPERREELTDLVLAHIHLMLSACHTQEAEALSRDHLARARAIFDAISYRYGALRCQTYSCLGREQESDTEDSRLSRERILLELSHMPRLFQLETLFVLSIAAERKGDVAAARQILKHAQELSRPSRLLSFLVLRRLLHLNPEDRQLHEQVERLKPKIVFV